MSDTLTVLLVDDEPLARQALRLLLANDTDVEVVGECSGADAQAIIERTHPDILFLDIQMPEVDGFDLLESLGIDRAPTVVFVTAYGHHALRAFDVHAIDYVLKPLDDARFAKALEHAKAQARIRNAGDAAGDPLGALLRERSRTTRRILVRDRDRTHVIETDTIDWIGAADYYAEIHVAGKTHLLRETMNELERRLAPERFFRVHRSAIINLERVREIRSLQHGDREIVLQDNTALRLSRARREEFERLLEPLRRRR